MNKLLWFFWTALLHVAPVSAQDLDGSSAPGGEVHVPLAQYEQWRERQQKTPPPASYAIGQSVVQVEIQETEKQAFAHISVDIVVETFDDGWTSIPLLPVDTALRETRIDGNAAALVAIDDQLTWISKNAQQVKMQIAYAVPVARLDSGYSLSLPVPRAAANQLQLRMPGQQANITVVPAIQQHTRHENGTTRVEASLSPTDSIFIAWRAAGDQAFAISRAHYRGQLQNDAVVWRAHYQVESFSAEPFSVTLFPETVTLIELSIDGKAATVFAQAQQFTTTISGRGQHEIEAVFQVPVQQDNGPPHIDLQIPRVPMSQFELTLPDEKDVKVSPPSNMLRTRHENQTEISVFMPMVEALRFSWTDAIPQDLQIQARANAISYHVFHAEEGVLHGHAIVAYEISRGSTNTLELTLDSGVQVNRIQGTGVTDWAASELEDSRKPIKVFLDRAVQGDYVLNVFYEQLITEPSGQSVPLPLLEILNVQRQRGMIALLVGRELTLNPVVNDGASAVGENQIPAFVRDQIEQVVAHTYKYTAPAKLAVEIAKPERKQGKFDAQIDTLISIGEVTLRGSSTVEISVKAGSVMALTLQLPDNINILAVSGPALRSRQVRESEAGQLIELEFNREMEGQFRLEINYERIMAESASDTQVPAVRVVHAEVEHGRIAVEALTAVEVQALSTEQLSSLDINELPQQLVLKTTNPILLAYKYVGAEPPAQLVLKMIRHQEIDVQLATIKQAHYQTLLTRDGLAVTTAFFTIRNSRRQFLRLNLPEKSQIWSVFVDGRAEKPARAGDDPSSILIKMINSASGFPVEVVYATRLEKMRQWGVLSARLPQPDMVVTETNWDVYLPLGPSYQVTDSNLDITIRGRSANPRAAAEQLADTRRGARNMTNEALRINVPSKGIHFAFEKLYANQSTDETGVSIRYFAKSVADTGLYLSLVAAILIWFGIVLLARRQDDGRSRTLIVISILAGALMLLASIGYLRTNPAPASLVSLIIGLLLSIGWLLQRWRQWRSRRALLE